MIEGPGNRHPGQGSANRRFLFANGMLELLWMHDPAEARSGPGRELHLAERSADPLASPFGLILRTAERSDAPPPFDGWRYQPDYFEPPRAFHVGANSDDLREPLCIFAPFPLPAAPIRRDATNSAMPIERVVLATPATPGSAVLASLAAVAGLEIVTGEAHLLEITLSGDCPPLPLDLRPALPLRLVTEQRVAGYDYAAGGGKA